MLDMRKGKVMHPAKLSWTPDWAKPIVAAALKLGYA
jgi:hypothetical protein